MIKVEHITKEFKKPLREPGLLGMLKTLFSAKHEIKVAVDDLSFEIDDGEIIGYIGSNGAGKSTTIKMMCGILTPTKGSVKINGMEPYKNKERNKILKNIGVVFGQRTCLWWDLPLVESFGVAKEIYEIDDTEYKERFAYLCDLLELKSFLNQPVRSLSLGQRMRADLGVALIHNPKLLFLDEPTIGLDVLIKEKILTAIKEIHAKYNTTIILTTHDMSDIENLCKRIIIIDSGKMLYDGPLIDIKNKFGDIRIITIETKNAIDEKAIKEKFNGILHIDVNNTKTSITIDAKLVHIDTLLSYLINEYKINDLGIKENSIENVVKKIYEEKKI